MTQSHIAILAYHSLDDSGSVLSTSPRVFAEQMSVLRDAWSESGVPLSDVATMIRGRCVQPMKARLATFDDGFRNVYEYALAGSTTLRFSSHGIPSDRLL